MVKTKCYDTPADEKNRRRISQSLTQRYPFLKHDIIGKSHCGRTIDSYSLGNENEQVLMCAAFHGMEWLTSLVLFRFLERVCEAFEKDSGICEINVARFLSRRGLIIVPCVNPDGVEISLNGECAAGKFEQRVEHIAAGKAHRWQANAVGVDINHNFSAGWKSLHEKEISSGITGPSLTQYGGQYPESEPETKALTSLCRKGTYDTQPPFTLRVRRYTGITGKTPQTALGSWPKSLHAPAAMLYPHPEDLQLAEASRTGSLKSSSVPPSLSKSGSEEIHSPAQSSMRFTQDSKR